MVMAMVTVVVVSVAMVTVVVSAPEMHVTPTRNTAANIFGQLSAGNNSYT